MLATPALRSAGMAAWQQFATPRIFVAIIRCHDSSGASANGKYSRNAALLTSTSSPPNSATARETASFVCSRLDTSAMIGKIRDERISWESCAACSSTFFLSISTSATLAPSRQKRRAVAAPIPLPPPVIIAIFPSSRPAINFFIPPLALPAEKTSYAALNRGATGQKMECWSDGVMHLKPNTPILPYSNALF